MLFKSKFFPVMYLYISKTYSISVSKILVALKEFVKYKLFFQLS